MDIRLPRILFGSSALGNLYEVVPDGTKGEIVGNWLKDGPAPVVIDSAGKYGAGLALENIGRLLREHGAKPDEILISNKLGWKRVPLTGDEPTFERGAWFGLEHDAVQSIGYDGILECWRQGNELLGDYSARLLSVHDPDEYVAAATTDSARAERYRDILDAYRALGELREAGEAEGIGVGSKDWRMIQRLHEDGVPLDWVMLANSFTLLTHPPEVMDFLRQLHEAGVVIINSAVFNAGFLIGGRYFDYQEITRESHPDVFDWRDRFQKLCARFEISPALACCQFALSPPGVAAISLNTSRADRVAVNVQLVEGQVSADFWQTMKDEGLLATAYPYL